MEPNQNDKNKPNPEDKRPKKNILVTLIAAVAIVILISTVFNAVRNSQYTQTTFTDFMTDWENNNLKEVEIQSDRILYLTKTEWEKPAAQQKACFTGLPSGDRLALARELEADGVTVNGLIVEDNSGIMMILYYVIMIAVLFGLMSFVTRKMGGGEGMMGAFGKSTAKVYMEKTTGVTFKDVAGQDEAKESLQEIIDFLHNPQKYAEIGAKLPKGALVRRAR